MSDCPECGMRDDDWFLCRRENCATRPSSDKDARITELEAEVERLTKERDEANADRDRWYESSFRATQRAEALSRTGAVKALDWHGTVDPTEGKVHYGSGVFGHWYAVSRVKTGLWTTMHHVGGRPELLPFSTTLSDAKAAAQADYERRILSALEPATQEGDLPYVCDACVNGNGGTCRCHPSPEGQQEPVGVVENNGGIRWFNPPIRLGTMLYTRPAEQAVTEAMPYSEEAMTDARNISAEPAGEVEPVAWQDATGKELHKIILNYQKQDMVLAGGRQKERAANYSTPLYTTPPASAIREALAEVRAIRDALREAQPYVSRYESENMSNVALAVLMQMDAAIRALKQQEMDNA